MERSSFHRLASARMCSVDRTRAVEILGRFHAAQSAFYVGGDADAVRALLTEDVAWHVPGRNAIAGDYRGTAAVLAYLTRRRELAERTFRMHPRDVLVGDGDEVAVVTDGTAVIGGVERRWSTVGLYRIRQERVAACWLLPLDADAFDAIWGPL
jgi:ketosteroid isomerase-like protein